MILNDIKEVLLTDIKNIFEDISIVEYINKYEPVTSETTALTIKSKKWITKSIDLKKEKVNDINIVLMNIFNILVEERYLINNKYKLAWNKIFLDFIGTDIVNLIITYKSVAIENTNPHDEKFGKVTWIKMIKSWAWITLYIFFETMYLKIWVNAIDLDIK